MMVFLRRFACRFRAAALVVEEIAPTYVFLASSDADHYVGQCLSPNGGDIFL